MKLSSIKNLGRYRNTTNCKIYNVKKGRNMQRGVDVFFYLYRGTRVIISDYDFFHNHEEVK